MAKNRVFYAAAVIALVLFYIYCDSYVPLVVLLMTVIFTVISGVLAFFSAKKVTVEIAAVQPSAQIGENAAFAVRMENTARFPVSQVCVTAECRTSFDHTVVRRRVTSPVAGHCGQNIYIYGSTKHCAVIACCIKRAAVTDTLGIIAFKPTLAQKSASCVVMPKIPDNIPAQEKVFALSSDSDTYSDTKRGDDSSQVFDVRDYVPGDDVRRIHWQLSSKRDSMIVKEYSRPIADKRVVLLETGLYGEDMESFLERIDTVVCAFLILMQSAMEDECTLTVRWYSGKRGEMFSYDVHNEGDIYPLVKEYLCESFSDRRNVSLRADNEYMSGGETTLTLGEARGWYVYDSSCSNCGEDASEQPELSKRYILMDARVISAGIA